MVCPKKRVLRMPPMTGCGVGFQTNGQRPKWAVNFLAGKTKNANFSSAILTNAPLQNGSIVNTDWRNATFSGAGLGAADLTGTTNLTQAQIDTVCYFSTLGPTNLPTGLASPRLIELSVSLKSLYLHPQAVMVIISSIGLGV